MTEAPLILIVDDLAQNLQILTTHLGEAGYRVAAAKSGEQALKALEKIQPDLILLDIIMPEMDGLEVCRRLKADPRLADIPVIFLTAKSESEDLLQGFEAGGVDYITKPFHTAELLARVKTHTELKRHRDLILEYSEQLKSHNQQLEALNQEKNHFLGIAAHDLKNPLGNILTLTQLIKMGTIDSEALSKNYLPIFENSAHKMLNIIDTLLDVNRIESGGVEVNFQSLQLADYVQHVVRNFTEVAARKQILLVFEPPAQASRMRSDAQLLVQVLDNLVSNAIKYSPSQTTVTLTLEPGAQHHLLKIQDQGPGFTEADKAKMFQKFAKLSARPTAGENSTGLGLSIVKLLVDLLEAEIEVATQPGQGSCFCLRFPAEQSA